MNNRRLTLLTAILIGCAFHALFLVGLQHYPLKTHTRAFHNIMAQEAGKTDYFASKERTEILEEVFSALQEEAPEVKHQLHELQAEYAPSLEIAFALHPSLELEVEPFIFEPDFTPTLTEEGELALQEGSRLFSKAPLVTSIEIPPLADVLFEDDPYASFGTIAGSEHFDIEVEYAPKRYRPGYVFKVTFQPRKEIVFKRIRQNVFFLIDRSNSIPRARYALNKQAVSLALTHLKLGDTFDILIFDGHVVRLAEDPLPWSEETVALAHTFLEQQGHGGYFAATDLYASLGKIIPQNVSDQEVNTAILLSDGDTYLSQEKQRQLIAEWTQQNQGKVSLFSLASGTGNNLPLLELISAFNQGRLLYSPDHQDLSNMLSNLLRSLQAPIGKKMVATPIPPDKQTTILLQPKAVHLGDLYQHRPFVVYGSTNRLCDFVLFLQGKYYDRRFDIKKNVSLETAKLGSFAIERTWTQLLAHEFYANYLEDGNLGHLEAAKQILRPMNIPTAWID